MQLGANQFSFSHHKTVLSTSIPRNASAQSGGTTARMLGVCHRTVTQASSASACMQPCPFVCNSQQTPQECRNAPRPTLSHLCSHLGDQRAAVFLKGLKAIRPSSSALVHSSTSSHADPDQMYCCLMPSRPSFVGEMTPDLIFDNSSARPLVVSYELPTSSQKSFQPTDSYSDGRPTDGFAGCLYPQPSATEDGGKGDAQVSDSRDSQVSLEIGRSWGELASGESAPP